VIGCFGIPTKAEIAEINARHLISTPLQNPRRSSLFVSQTGEDSPGGSIPPPDWWPRVLFIASGRHSVVAGVTRGSNLFVC